MAKSMGRATGNTAGGRAGAASARTAGRGSTGPAYMHGSAARKLDEEARSARYARAEERRANHNFRTIQGGRKAEKTSRAETVAHLTLMAGALVVAAFVLYRYVDVQTSLESSVTTIATLEKQLATMRQENDEAYSRANSTVDLEEVKRVAIQELGMKYADEGQIVVYSDEGAADYVRQVAQIPEAGK